MDESLKHFGVIQAVLSIIAMPFGFLLWGLAAVPGVWAFRWVDANCTGMMEWFGFGAAIGFGVLAWFLIGLFVTGLFGMMMRPRTGPEKAPTRSWLTIRWAFMSFLHRLALPCLPWMVPSIFADTYYRMMGAKIGRGVQINSHAVNDAYMIEIGARSVIGGDAVINGHLFEKDGIHMARVIIGKDCVIGTRSQINPGCMIGDGAVIASKAVLAKHTQVPAGEVWGGIPARCIRRADGSRPDSD
jgi:acetyltransferase-like isoleucine patch superfamily enzyme